MAGEEKYIKLGQLYNVLVNKNNRKKFQITTNLAVGTQLEVMNYIVGYGHLKVYWDGILCDGGTNNTFQYQEIGTVGSSSNKISFWDVVPAGTTIICTIL